MGLPKAKTTKIEHQRIKEELIRKGYSEVLIDHWLNPRNVGRMENYNGYSGKITASCGDSIWIWLKVKNNVIKNATYLSDICIGAVSSGSMLTEMVKGKSITKASLISSDNILSALGGLPDNFVHCARLAERALKIAIADYNAYEANPWKRLYGQERK